MKKVADVFSIGAQFIDYCKKEGWIIEKGSGKNKAWYITEEGEEKLKKFNIKI